VNSPACQESQRSGGRRIGQACLPPNRLAVVRHLERRGLADGALLTDERVLVTDVSRRHANYSVTRDGRTGYFVKQATTPERAATLAREAEIYALLRADRRCDGLHPYLPALCDYDPNENVLVLELLPGAVNLREYQLRTRRFSTRAARAVGRALARLHDPRRLDSIDRETVAAFTDPPPGALSLHDPDLSLVVGASAASLELIRLMQSTADIGDHLDQLRAQWRCDGLIHRDIKSDNVVTHLLPHSGRAGHPIMVDWELAGVGDPDWDTGSVFGDYLTTWLHSIPMGAGEPFDTYVQWARFPLPRLQPVMGAFWGSYVQTRGFDRQAAHDRILRAIRYSAARLVQSAFEQSQVSYELGTGAAATLQLSLNILLRPREAGTYLLGVL
jgi:Phosphotransferase enzyme family